MLRKNSTQSYGCYNFLKRLETNLYTTQPYGSMVRDFSVCDWDPGQNNFKVLGGPRNHPVRRMFPAETQGPPNNKSSDTQRDKLL